MNDQFKSTIMAILMALEVGSTPSFRPSYQEGAWPKNFFDAIIRSDWKRWILAVRKEKFGWLLNDAITDVMVEDIISVAPVILLGELFTIKKMGLPSFDNMQWEFVEGRTWFP